MNTHFRLKKNQQGFSLVELMVVVAIIGILAALAVPKFQQFQAKARQTEAKNNLSHIYTLQESYYGDNEEYGDSLAKIGFVTKGKLNGKEATRYGYSLSNVGATTFTATATDGGKVFPGCTTKDTWTIDQNKNLNNSVNGLEKCL